MTSVKEIAEFIRSKVALFKAMDVDQVPFDQPVHSEIGLIGEDFGEIDYLLRAEYDVETEDADYSIDVSIWEWAELIRSKIL